MRQKKNLKYYQQLASDLGVGDKVIFTGLRADVEEFYTISDVFLFPTHYEPFSNVVLEAMSFNNVVFTTQQNGASEILNSNYIMQSPRDVSVSGKIDALLEAPDQLETIKQKNLDRVSQFSIQKNLLNTINTIKPLL